VPLADKIALCLRADEALAHDDVKVRMASVRALREEKVFISSEGSVLEQRLVDCGGGIDAIALGDGLHQVRSYPSAHTGTSAQAGWEFVEGLGLEREAPRVAEEAAALLQADECPSGRTTVVIDAEQTAPVVLNGLQVRKQSSGFGGIQKARSLIKREELFEAQCVHVDAALHIGERPRGIHHPTTDNGRGHTAPAPTLTGQRNTRIPAAAAFESRQTAGIA
jgi:hypothetical protein